MYFIFLSDIFFLLQMLLLGVTHLFETVFISSAVLRTREKLAMDTIMFTLQCVSSFKVLGDNGSSRRLILLLASFIILLSLQLFFLYSYVTLVSNILGDY